MVLSFPLTILDFVEAFHTVSFRRLHSFFCGLRPFLEITLNFPHFRPDWGRYSAVCTDGFSFFSFFMRFFSFAPLLFAKKSA